MPTTQTIFATLATATLIAGCAAVPLNPPGDKATEAALKALKPIPGKTSVYFCVPDSFSLLSSSRLEPVIDGKSLGPLSKNLFAHTVVEPGQHEAFIRIVGALGSSESGKLMIEGAAGQILYVWIGVTGGGFGVTTLDWFSKTADGEACVRSAAYVARPT